MLFYWSLIDSKTPQASRTLLSILANLNNAVVWMVSTRPFISSSSSLFIYPLVTVSRASIIIGINVTFMFHCFFSSLVRSRYLSFFSPSFTFTLWSAGKAKSTILQVFFFVYYYYYYYCLLLKSFHISISWWSFTGIWVTASLLQPPGLFPVFWLF